MKLPVQTLKLVVQNVKLAVQNGEIEIDWQLLYLQVKFMLDK